MTRSVSDHLATILGEISTLAPAAVGLSDAGGCVLATDLTSTTPIPLFDNSAMDGYAVHSADLTRASEANPITLPVAGDIPAGATTGAPVEPGTAARIMTGAAIPAGADAIVPVEYTDGGTDTVQITLAPDVGRHLRTAGADLAAGDTVLRAGTVLNARQLAAAAAAGHGHVQVYQRPRVAVISTGSELITPGTAPTGGQIPDSNSYLLERLVAESGGVPVQVGAVPDDEATFARTLAEVSPKVDVIICSGGVSVGAFDVVKAVLAPEPDMWFGPVAMQPGKPQGFGQLSDGTTVFTLPGNPVSVYVSFAVFVRPALRAMAGETTPLDTLTATVTTGWISPAEREQYMPVRITTGAATPLISPVSSGGSGSHLVGTLAAADGLARVPVEVTTVQPGNILDIVTGI